MAFVKFNRHKGEASNLNIDSNGRIYANSLHNLSGKYDIFWDEETQRIGLKPNVNGRRKMTKVPGGTVASIKSFLDKMGIVYPQLCFSAWDGDMFTIKVKKESRDNASWECQKDIRESTEGAQTIN